MPSEEELFLRTIYERERSIYCSRAIMTTSDGVWLNDNPFHFSLPILLFQLTVIFVVCKLTHAVLRRLGQPLIISQIMVPYLPEIDLMISIPTLLSPCI